MASIFLTTTCEVKSYNPRALADFERIINLAKQDQRKQHNVVDCPKQADLVIFINDRRIYHSGIYASEIFQKYQEKSLLIDFTDQTIPRIPGLYATVPFHLQQYPIYEYLFYPHDCGCLDLDKAMNSFSDYKYLFSFMGDVTTHPIRSEILKLIHPRSYLKNSWKGATVELFSEVSIDSKFILCPRGAAAATIRLFEIMRASRVPVIISDEWQENVIDGDWQEFSVRIPEKNIQLIPDILERLEPQALEMGKKARIAWEKNFSTDFGFHWLIEACLKIQNSRTNYDRISSRNIYMETFGTNHFAPFWKEFIRRKIGKI